MRRGLSQTFGSSAMLVNCLPIVRQLKKMSFMTMTLPVQCTMYTHTKASHCVLFEIGRWAILAVVLEFKWKRWVEKGICCFVTKKYGSGIHC